MDNTLLNLITGAVLIIALSALIAYRYGLAAGPGQALKQLQYDNRQLRTARDELASTLRNARQENQKLEFINLQNTDALKAANERLDQLTRSATSNNQRTLALTTKAERLSEQLRAHEIRQITLHDADALTATARTLELAERTFTAFNDTKHAALAKQQAALLLNLAARNSSPLAASA